MFAKLKAMAGDAAGSTARAATRAKHEAKIAYLEREIRLCKERFGAEVWELYPTDRIGADVLYAKIAEEVGDYELQIEGLRQSIADLKVKTSPGGVSADKLSGPETCEEEPPSYDSLDSLPSVPHPAPAPATAPAPAPKPSPSPAPAPFVPPTVAAPPPLQGRESAGEASDGMLAGLFTSVAGMAAATGTTDTVARAAAPHVASALESRYAGQGGLEKMAGDAQTVGRLGQKVAGNPAVQALGAALVRGVVSNATSSASTAPKRY